MADVKTHGDLSVTVGDKKYGSVQEAIDALGAGDGVDLVGALRVADQNAKQDALEAARFTRPVEVVANDASLGEGDFEVAAPAATGDSPATGTSEESDKASREQSDSQLRAAEGEGEGPQGFSEGGAPRTGAAAKAEQARARTTSTRSRKK